MDIWIRDGHADIFGDAHVGYSAILSDNAEVDADIRIHMANGSYNRPFGLFRPS